MTIHLPIHRVRAVPLAIEAGLLASMVDDAPPRSRHFIESARFALLRANAMLFGGGLLGLTSYNAFMDSTRYGYVPAAMAAVLVAFGIRDLTKIL